VRANFSKVSKFILYGNLLIFEKFTLVLQYNLNHTNNLANSITVATDKALSRAPLYTSFSFDPK
jgi:hypothetical protein